METTSQSFDLLRDAVNAWCGGSGEGYRAVTFILPVAPMPAPRPKFTRDGYAYSPKPYVTWRGQVERHIPKLEPLISGIPCAVALDLVLPPYKTVNTPWPKGDVDNYAKSVFDIVTKKKRIWKDDVQVNVAFIQKRFTIGDETPHAAVYIREIL